MIILGIDPSINETGWAVIDTTRILDAGQAVSQMKCNVIAHGVWCPKAKDPYERLEKLCSTLDTKLTINPSITDIVIETTSGKLAGRLKGTNANMLLYPVAVGGLVVQAWDYRDDLEDQGFTGPRVHLVLENFWTDGVSKNKRHAATCAEFGLPKKTNHNAVDAIGLGAWWYSHRKMLEATG